MKHLECSFVQDAGLSKVHAKAPKFGGSETVVVIDPPRAGCTPEFLKQLIAFAPARVVYVSCDPSTQVIEPILT